MEISALAAGSCSPNDLYYGVGSDLWKYDTMTQTSTYVKALGGIVDAMGIAGSGFAYLIVTNTDKISKLDLTTGTETTFARPAAVTGSTTWDTGGAVNPATDIYYYVSSDGYM